MEQLWSSALSFFLLQYKYLRLKIMGAAVGIHYCDIDSDI